MRGSDSSNYHVGSSRKNQQTLLKVKIKWKNMSQIDDATYPQLNRKNTFFAGRNVFDSNAQYPSIVLRNKDGIPVNLPAGSIFPLNGKLMFSGSGGTAEPIEVEGFSFGKWISAKTYITDQVIWLEADDKIYACTVGNSDAVFNPSNWQELSNTDLLNNRVSDLENLTFKISYYAEITTTSGTISKPTGSTILLDQWSNGVDSVLSKIPGGTGTKPDFEDTGVDVSSFDSSGNYTLSGALPTNPSALIYYISIPLKDYDNLNTEFVVEYAEIMLQAYNLENVIYVADSGGDFTNEKDALDSIIDNSSTNRYVILSAPGIRAIDNPMQGKEYVTLRSLGDLQTTRLVASNPNQDLITMANFFTIEGFTLWGVTGASNYAVNQSVAGLSSLSRCALAECTNGVLLNNVGGAMTINDCASYNLTATTTRGIFQQAGDLVINRYTGSLGNITTLIETTGINSKIEANNVKSLISTLGTGVYVRDSAIADIHAAVLANLTDGLVISGGSRVYITGSSVSSASNDGLKVDDVGTNTKVDIQASVLEDNAGYDLNALSATCVITGTGKTSIDNINFVNGAQLYGAIIDTKEDDEGFNILGELHVGLPEQGAESVLGQGDSYTRGMLVYTETSGGVFSDISSDAASASGSTFTFPGIATNNAIYIASSLSSTDKLEYYGVKSKVNTAAIIGSGSIVLEYWNGSSWAELNGMEVDSSNSYYPHANNYFQNTGSHHIRFNSNLAIDPWIKNDPITPALGIDYYWTRFRVVNAITTAPIFEQFKLHTSRFEVNSDGWVEYFGKARPIGQLPFAIGQDTALEGNLGNQSLWINQDIGSGIKENNFNAVGDIIGRTFFMPQDLDTSSPIKFKLVGRPSGNGTIELTIRWSSVTAGDLIYTSDPGVLLGASSQVVSQTVATGVAEFYDFDLDVSNFISRREGGQPDVISISIESTVLTGSQLAMFAIEAEYTKWCEGGHV